VANRVNVNITARDLTRPELSRMRQNFRALGQDMDRAVASRTRQNFDRLSQSVNQARRDLTALRGAIPDDEFFRMDAAIRQSQRTMQRGFNRVGDRAFARVAAQLRSVTDEFDRLDRDNQIRVRVDNSALRRADAQLAAWRRQQARNDVRVRVNPDVNRGFGRRLTRLLTAPFRQAGSVLGGILSDGLGQGIVQGFTSAGPVGMAVFAAIIAASLSVIGAALSGLIVAAFGLAFTGIAGWSAATSKDVQRQWSRTLKSLQANFKEVGEPMIPVLERGIRKLEVLGDKIAPVFKQAMEEAAPATNLFIDKLFEGIERFGKAMFEPMMEAWEVFAPVFGDVFSDFLEDLGENFADIANLVRDHSVEIEIALRAVFKIISGLVEVVEFLGRAWVSSLNTMGFLIEWGLRPLTNAALTTFEAILFAADTAFGWIPGIGDDLGKARDAFAGFKETTLASLDEMAEGAYGLDDALDRMNKTRKLKADIRDWEAQLALAREDLKTTTSQKAEAKVQANIKDLTRKLAIARGQLADLNGRVARTYVYTTYTDIHTSLGTRQRRHGLATGGVRGMMAAASGGVRSHQTLVGEQGPEIVDLPVGSRVRSNSDTRRTLGQSAPAGGGGSTLVLQSSGRRVDDLLLEILREAIHQRGGDPVRVLGGR
jgi:hypothetical protein